MAKTRERRADDQGRLAEEIARGQGPQAQADKVAEPAKRPRGRPRKHPLPDPTAPKRPRGRPRKNTIPLVEPEPPKPIAETPAGPPAVEPDEVELPPTPTDEAGRPLSLMWSIVRSRYDREIVRELEAILSLGALELDDLVWLELAEHQRLGRLGKGATERMQERLISAQQQSRKQLMRILVERGPVGGVNARQVRVPEGLELEALTVEPDLGDDVLAEPVIEHLPQRYQEAARATLRPTPEAR